MSFSFLASRFLTPGTAVGLAKAETLRMMVEMLGVPLDEEDGRTTPPGMEVVTLDPEEKGGTTTGVDTEELAEPVEKGGTTTEPELADELDTEGKGGTTREPELADELDAEGKGGTTTEPELDDKVGREPGGRTRLLELELAEEAEGGLTLFEGTDEDEALADDAEVVCWSPGVEVVDPACLSQN